MATATHTFVRIYFRESDGTIAKEEFEIAQDVNTVGIAAYKKEVVTE